jgi:hypothetical protein
MKRVLLILVSLTVLVVMQNPKNFISVVEDPPVVSAAPTASGALSPAPLNFNFDAPSEEVTGTPDNHDFETGDFTDWTESGAVEIHSGGPTGYYLDIDGTFQGGSIISDSTKTIDNDAYMLTFDYNLSKWSSINFYIATNSPDYDNFVLFGGVSAGGASVSWTTKTWNFYDHRGDTMKMKFTFASGCCDAGNSVKLDNAAMTWDTLPHWEPTGSNGDTHIVERLK